MDTIGYIDVVTYPASENRPQQVDQNHPLPVAFGAPASGQGGSNGTPFYEKGAYASTTDAIAQAVNAVSTNLAALDCKDFQSIELQFTVSSAYTGTLAIQVSSAAAPGATDWVTKTLVSVNGGGLVSSLTGAGQAVGAWQGLFGDIGARWIRVIQTAWTSGQVTVLAGASALSTSTIPQLLTGVAINAGSAQIGRVTNGVASENVSTTALAASATYSSTIDQSTTTQTRTNQLEVLVAHTAGLTPGHLEIQESQDATTYRITRRVPVPSDGLVHSFRFPMNSRAYKVNFVNGATAQTAFFIQHSLIGIDAPIDDRQVLAIPLTTTALAASATFTGPTLDLGPTHKWGAIRALAVVDQASTLYVQESKDGATWRNVRAVDAGLGATVTGNGVSVPADTVNASYMECKIMERYVRVNLVNTTATLQTTTQVDCALIAA